MIENRDKSMFQIIVKNINTIIVAFFITFIFTFTVIEFAIESQDIKNNLKEMNNNNLMHIEELVNHVTSYNEIIINSYSYHSVDKNIIDKLISSNDFVSNLIILNQENEMLYQFEASEHFDFLIEHSTIETITKNKQYQFINVGPNDQVDIVYKYNEIYFIYDINETQAIKFINYTNKNINFILKNKNNNDVIFSDMEYPETVKLNEYQNNLINYSVIKIFDTEYYLINTISSHFIIHKLFLNSYLTLLISFLILIISLILTNRKIHSITDKPFQLFIDDMEKLLDLDYKEILSIENNRKSYFEFSKILSEFKKICLYNENEHKKVIDGYEEKLHLAVESNKSKSLFLANMSHEMRTPLNAIIGYTQLSKKVGFDDKDKIKEYFDSINASSEILLQKINDILDLSKIEAKQFDLHPKPTNIRNLVKELYELLHIQAERKHIEFSYYIDPQIPKFLEIDETRLKQVLINILNNAIKFTEKGFVKLEIELFGYSNDSIVLDYRIIDSGCGIPRDKIDKIFLPFVQIDNNNNRQVGTGLGLTISQDIIRLMGGEISVTSKDHEGSIFTFTTIFKISEVEIHDVVSNNEVSNEVFEKMIKNKRILIAEDNIINQIFMKEIFSVYKKHDIEFASDGQEAVNMVKNKRYDLLFMDIQMPKMSGIEATIHIRKTLNNQHIPIIALTANAFTEQISEYLEKGMSDFLPKPIDIQKLKKMIIKYINTTEV